MLSEGFLLLFCLFVSSFFYYVICLSYSYCLYRFSFYLYGRGSEGEIRTPQEQARTPNLPTKSLDFRGFDSSRLLIQRGGIPRSIGNFPESSSQAMLVGTMSVGRLGVIHTMHIMRIVYHIIYNVNNIQTIQCIQYIICYTMYCYTYNTLYNCCIQFII